jgi:hypothetical protein
VNSDTYKSFLTDKLPTPATATTTSTTGNVTAPTKKIDASDIGKKDKT